MDGAARVVVRKLIILKNNQSALGVLHWQVPAKKCWLFVGKSLFILWSNRN
jgi:ABC-type molybdenum transport system ATPase subunit/photorepair protein PhrA